MALRTLEKGGAELTNPYPKFEEIGDYVEGNISGFVTDDFGNKRIQIFKGFEEETGEPKYQLLPSHANLKQYYDQLDEGVWVRIELKKVIKSKNPEYADKNIYKVQVDDDKYVEFGDDEE